MFPTARVRGINQTSLENSGVFAIKNISSNTQARPALGDLHANASGPCNKPENKQKVVKKEPEFNDVFLDVCSHHQEIEDTMEDIWPKSERFTAKDILKIVDSYTNRCSTPPPPSYNIDIFEFEIAAPAPTFSSCKLPEAEVFDAPLLSPTIYFNDFAF